MTTKTYNLIIQYLPYVILISLFTTVLFYNTGFLVDEKAHYPRVLALARGESAIVWGTTLPGFHTTASLFLRLLQAESPQLVRYFNLLIGLGTIFIFKKVLRQFQPALATKDIHLYALLFAIIPIILPFYSLVYTEAFSLFLILLMLYYEFRKEHFASGAVGLLTVLVRQTNIIWLTLPIILFLHEKTRAYFTVRTAKGKIKHSLGASLASLSKELAQKYFLHAIGAGLFLAYVVINQEVAFGDKLAHPTEGYYTGNIFGFFGVLFVVFAPTAIPYLLQKKNLFKIGLAAIPGWFLYRAYFDFSHHYNTHEFVLINGVLTRLQMNTLLYGAVFLTMLLGGLFYLKKLSSISRERYIFLLTLIVLSQSWLIQPRYYIVPITLFLFTNRGLVTKKQLIYLGLLSAGISFGLAKNLFFI